MNSLERPDSGPVPEKAESRLSSEKIQRMIDRLRKQEGKVFDIAEDDQEYKLTVQRKNGSETVVIRKSGNEEIDEGAIYVEIMSPELKDDYVGSPKLGREEE